MTHCQIVAAGAQLLPGKAVDACCLKTPPWPERWHAVYLSPHSDDAVLSCGASIRRRAEAGLNILVITVCAGTPPAGDGLSAFASTLHARWSEHLGGTQLSAADVAELRRAEDDRAVARLGASVVWLDIADAIYRRDRPQGWPYDSDGALFGDLAPRDGALVRRLCVRLRGIAGIDRGTLVFAPLAVGGHVDHRLVRHAAESWRGGTRLWHYEDFPYAADPAALAAALAPASTWRSWTTAVTERHLQAKIAAAACYGSQLSTFWSGSDDMARQIRAFAARRADHGLAERCWRPAPTHPMRHEQAGAP